MKITHRTEATSAMASGRLRPGRAGSLAAALVGAALLAVGCGASPSGNRPAQKSNGSSPGSNPAARYVQCMRAHGVPNFPDPVDGHIQLQPGSGIDPSSPQFQAAGKACQALAPHSSPSGASVTGVRTWPAFAALLRQQAAAGHFSGAVLIAQNGKPILTQADGFANRQRRAPNTLDTKFDIGSIGKTFTAVAIAQLAEQGKLSFNDPISTYLSGLPTRMRDITIDELLTHTSGLGDVFAHWHPTASPLEVSQIVKRIEREPLQLRPGSGFSYSNSGYVVLGAIIQAVTHQNYYQYVRQHVFKPAGMTHTGWYTLDEVPNMAHGYIPVHRPGKPVAFQDSHGAGGAGNPSGGVYSTVGDLLRFAHALLRHKLLSAAMTDTVLAGKVNTGRPGPAQVSKYAYGFEDEDVNGVRIVGHGGGAPGIEAQLRIYPTLGYTVVILANEDSAATPIYFQINQIVASDPHPQAAGNATRPKDNRLALAGRFDRIRKHHTVPASRFARLRPATTY